MPNYPGPEQWMAANDSNGEPPEGEAFLPCGHPKSDGKGRWYAAGTCQATFEAVAEIEDADDGADGCLLCGLPSYQHRSEER